MMKVYITYLAVASVLTFILYALDKLKAKARAWRIPERTLLAASLFGGAVGGTFAMLLFRHKTRHLPFKLVNGAAIILHGVLGAVIYLFA